MRWKFRNETIMALSSGNLFNNVYDVARGVWPSHAARGTRLAFHLPRLVEEGENFAGQAFRREFRLGNHAACAGARHLLGVAQLMAVCGVPERDEDGGTTRRGNFRRGDGAGPADNHVRPGKTLRHVREEGHDLRKI